MIFQILLAIDQLFNALLFAGMADETLSARAFRRELQGSNFWTAFRQMVDSIFFWQNCHCFQAWKHEIERAQLPSDYKLY